MASRLFISTILLFVFFIVAGQKLEFEAGYGSYNMKQARKFIDFVHKDMSRQLPLKFNVSDNFPPHMYYHIGLIFDRYGTYNFGGGLNYYTTGGRLSYGDYSGFYTFDMIAVAYSLTGTFQYVIKDKPKFKILAYNDVEILNSQLRIEEEMNLYQTKTQEKSSVQVSSIGIMTEPGLAAEYFVKLFSVGINMGYGIGVLNGPLHLKDDPQSKLEMNDGENMKLDWSGFRIGLKVGYKINFIKQ